MFIVIIPLFTCDYPETFSHNVNLEFIADQLYSDALQKNEIAPEKDVSQTELVKQ